ncbi:hypothetical protein DEO72_LG4g262 [Vigna unguiculata]|uniref:Gnk2-homologous domain-containing protein n=1 Tax=Vigna unguiculata TaxID=3917 RepID=A0A4D6LLI5_VIGUN|nr:hypothetical protein DEO72_LG4g262 [Vigna unguiculata]
MLASNFCTTSLILQLLCLLFHATSAAIYSAHFCTNQTFYASDTKFQSKLNTFLSSLVSNSSLPSLNGFFRTSVDDIDGRFLYRGDVNATVCHGCVAAAAANITRLCPNDTESYIWYDECMLIYSNNTFDNDDIVPGIPLNDEGSTVNTNHDHFNQLLSNVLNSLEGKALESSMGEKKFAVGAVSVTSAQTLYGMAQCEPDSTSGRCAACFGSAISTIPTCCNGSGGARVLLPICSIRYQLYPFLYNSTMLIPSSGMHIIMYIIDYESSPLTQVFLIVLKRFNSVH